MFYIFEVKPIKHLLCLDFSHLVIESKIDGFRFLERLVNDYKDGINTFNQEGESLYGVFNEQGVLIAIGGLNKDPYANDEKVGRLRRFYVAKNHRRNGIGSLLLKTIILEARHYYEVLVLHSDTMEADQFYRSLGFYKGQNYLNSTHYLNLTYKR